LDVYKRKDKIHYELYPYFNNQLEQYSIFMDNVSLFEIEKQKLKICLKEQEQEYCLTKRLFI
ncbi:hypothetical protein ACISIM_03750, partial [Campylobacter coli]